ncbi:MULTISPECIES: hypothetical protein [Flavobacterium]|uniref:TIGR02646 family protein n=1 Tax=Flavobacterium jumunjinense TaxID=998845 RepID=A0ABV5GRR0_9FLAO|nr:MULTISPECIES: hypothetical protein [Flavobacterium]
MINLNSKNRDLEKISEKFYIRIEKSILSKIKENKALLNKFYTNNTNKPLGDFLEKEIPDLIKSPLSRQFIKKYNDELKKLFEDNYKLEIDKSTESKKRVDTPFKKAINQILFYESQDIWKAYQVSIDIGTNTCAYCNRTYITTVGDDDKKFVRGDFDHFLAKSIYPYFRLSFYNLIPCCVICNRNAKGKNNTSIKDNIYPYAEGFDNKTIFTYLPKNYDEIIGKGKPLIDFLFLGNDDHIRKSKENIKLFKLREQYSVHSQELNEIINKRRVFSDSYLKNLQSDFPNIIKSIDDAYLLAFGKEFDLVNDEKKPLSKFTRDIVDELGLKK